MASSSGKKVSNSTLGLRFMQNALRAKEIQQAELEQAKVKDEAEWEIDPRLRAAWGEKAAGSGRASITCEPSYLPFLFPSLKVGEPSTRGVSVASTSTLPLVRGRRKFNKHGEEVLLEEPLKTQEVPEHTEDVELSDSPPAKRLYSISSSGRPKNRQDNRKRSDGSAKVSVLAMLSEQSSQSVGVDMKASRTVAVKPEPEKAQTSLKESLRVNKHDSMQNGNPMQHPRAASPSSARAEKQGFVRPAGVVSPASALKKSTTKRPHSSEDSTTNTKSGPADEPGRRRKKKRNNSGSNSVVKPSEESH